MAAMRGLERIVSAPATITLSMRLMRSSSWCCWNTKPQCVRWNTASASSRMPVMVSPSNLMVPAVGRSKPASA
nr:hypothetical protein [Bifidobacterium pseudolongum]